MSLRSRLAAFMNPEAMAAPQNAVQSAGGGTVITTSEELQEFLRSGAQTRSGPTVTAETAMRVGAVYACVRIISGAVATMPLHVKRRLDAQRREDASDTKLWSVVHNKPNRWQTPSQFRRMQQAHVLMRGNAYAYVVRDHRGDVTELLPLHPDRVEPRQRSDLSIEYLWTAENGTRQLFAQDEVLHLLNLTLDGYRGVSPLTYARETIGDSLAMAEHGANLFRNGAQVGGVMQTDKALGQGGRENVRAALDEFRSDGERAGKTLILEDGLKYEKTAMTSEDAQWVDARKFSRSDIAMFFGVPPHMIGDTDKSTSWGSGIEQQSLGFIAYTLEDHLTMWEEALKRDCVAPRDRNIYLRFNRSALVKGDIKTRFEAYQLGRKMKVLSANEVRALEDMNPYDGGDVYENPEINPGNKGGAP